MGIEIGQASQFFTFWNCINQLISLFLNDKSNKSILLPKMSEFLGDKNVYTQFLKRMQQAYIEPTIQSIYVIFESLMIMLNASDIANSTSDFKTVSKNGATFFVENPSEFYKISSGIETLLKNETKITDLFSTDTLIEEYKFVRKVSDEESQWEISFNNRIRLINIKNTDEIVADFVKLRLLTARLDISMIRTENIRKSKECQNSEKFVKFFQTAEALYDKLVILHKLNFDIGYNIFTYKSLDTSEIDDLITNLEKVIQIINEKFLDVYTNEICLFTKEQFFILFQLLNRYFKDNIKSPDLVSIFEGTIKSFCFVIQLDYYNLIKDNFRPIEFDDNFSEKTVQKFGDNIVKFSKILTSMISELLEKRKRIDDYSADLEIKGNLDEYLTGGTVRCINANIIKDEGKHDISSKYQLHSMILYLLKSYRPADITTIPLPFPSQLLICSMSVTLSQIDSFLGFFKSRNEEKCIFIVVSPIQLQPTLYDYLITKLIEINGTTASQSRIVILFENEDLNKKPIFKEVIRKINVDSFKPITNTEQLRNLYKIKDIYYGIQAFYIYEKFPRTGKTHAILQHISDNYPNHIYTRILVDESTSLTTLINRLNEVQKIDSKDKTIIIHFNVDGKCNTNFHLYIQNLAFFRSLNDGISIPFIANNKMVFYFEFGSHPSFDKEDFIQNVFPIADYMEEIKIPSKTDEFFTYDEYHIIPHDEIKGTLKIIKREKYRGYLIEAATIAMLRQDKDSFLRNDKSAFYVKYSDYLDSYRRLYSTLENDPKKAYGFLLAMFKDTFNIFKDNKDIKSIKNIQDFFNNPLISQISDVSIIISKFKGPILSQSIYGTEASVGYNIRRFLVGLIIEASITNCGLPYLPPLNTDGKVIDNPEKDQNRFMMFKQFITRGHTLAVSDPAGEAEEQNFTLICNEPNEFDELMKKFNYYVKDEAKYQEIKYAVKSAVNVIDSEWKKSQNFPDELFKIFANIFNLHKYEENKYNITMLVNVWRSLDDKSRYSLQEEWDKNIEIIKSNIRSGAKTHEEITKTTNLNRIYKTEKGDENFERKRTFWTSFVDQIGKDQVISIYNIIKEENRIFDRGIEEDKNSECKMIFVSRDIYTFISNCEKYIQNENSLLLKYTLTPHNIMLFIHIAYRIYSNIPIILMGETGSGKTFTMNFLREIISKNTKIIKYFIKDNTKEEDLRSFLRSNIEELTKERSKLIKDKLMCVTKDINFPASIIDSIKSLPIKKDDEEITTDFEDIMESVTLYIDSLLLPDLSKYDIATEEERDWFKKDVIFKLRNIFKTIEMELKKYIFFFDEFNTASCQWFIKEIILDRYFEGKMLPNYIQFVCTANPSRKLKEALTQDAFDALDPIYNDDSQDERNNLAFQSARNTRIICSLSVSSRSK